MSLVTEMFFKKLLGCQDKDTEKREREERTSHSHRKVRKRETERERERGGERMRRDSQWSCEHTVTATENAETRGYREREACARASVFVCCVGRWWVALFSLARSGLSFLARFFSLSVSPPFPCQLPLSPGWLQLNAGSALFLTKNAALSLPLPLVSCEPSAWSLQYQRNQPVNTGLRRHK